MSKLNWWSDAERWTLDTHWLCWYGVNQLVLTCSLSFTRSQSSIRSGLTSSLAYSQFWFDLTGRVLWKRRRNRTFKKNILLRSIMLSDYSSALQKTQKNRCFDLTKGWQKRSLVCYYSVSAAIKKVDYHSKKMIQNNWFNTMYSSSNIQNILVEECSKDFKAHWASVNLSRTLLACETSWEAVYLGNNVITDDDIKKLCYSS